jgi:geranylgeranyl pyrophosphate synthase
MAAIGSTGALDYARRRAREEVDAGRAALEHFPDGEHRSALIALAEHALERDR